jgi:hypothetical protein
VSFFVIGAICVHHDSLFKPVELTSLAITTWLIRQQLLEAAVSLSVARAAEQRYAGGALAIGPSVHQRGPGTHDSHGDCDVFPRSPRSIRQSLTRHRDNPTRAIVVLFRQPRASRPSGAPARHAPRDHRDVAQASRRARRNPFDS